MYKENHYAFELHLPVWYKFLLKISLLSSLWPTRIHISIYIKKWYRFSLHESTEYCMRLSNINIQKYQLRNTFYWHAFLWYTVIFVSKMLVHIPSKKFQCHLILKMILHDITLSDMVSLYLEIVYYTLFYPN